MTDCCFLVILAWGAGDASSAFGDASSAFGDAAGFDNEEDGFDSFLSMQAPPPELQVCFKINFNFQRRHLTWVTYNFRHTQTYQLLDLRCDHQVRIFDDLLSANYIY